MIKARTTLRELLHGGDELLIDARLSPRQDIDVAALEVVEQLPLRPAFPAGEPAFGNVEVVVWQSLTFAGFDQEFANAVEQRGERRRCAFSVPDKEWNRRGIGGGGASAVGILSPEPQ